jgi:hypothetical protein
MPKHKTSEYENVCTIAVVRWRCAVDAFAWASFDPSEELEQSVDEALVHTR